MTLINKVKVLEEEKKTVREPEGSSRKEPTGRFLISNTQESLSVLGEYKQDG